MEPRQWGWWTEHKLQILGDNLQVFAQASGGKASERVYLDLFAGRPENTRRETNEEILGSVRRALEVTPPFTQVHLFELPSNAQALDHALHQRYPGRNIRVHAGDCNQTIQLALGELARIRWAPTFAFVDQQAAEVHWSTLREIAAFRRGKTKAEMWILFGTSFLPRGLNLTKEQMNAEFGDRITALFGSEEWIPVAHGRRRGLLSPAEVRFELVNLMRWRLERVLGYRESHAFTMKNTGGQDLYDMIFVSDHAVGDKVMRHLYGKALAEHEAMRRDALALRRAQRDDARRRAVGEHPLFDLDPSSVRAPKQRAVPDDRIYAPEPPHEPYRLTTHAPT